MKRRKIKEKIQLFLLFFMLFIYPSMAIHLTDLLFGW